METPFKENRKVIIDPLPIVNWVGIMGLFDSIFRRKKEIPVRDRLQLEPLANKIAGILQTEVTPRYIGKNPGFLTKSGIVGIFKRDTYFRLKRDLESVKISDLESEEGRVGVKGGSWFNKELIFTITKGLKVDHVLINRHKPTPLIIETPEGCIQIAPVIWE